MRVSFKVSKSGTRYRPKPQILTREKDEILNEKTIREEQADIVGRGEDFVGHSVSLASSGWNPLSTAELEVSFSLNLFPDGFSIAKPNEGILAPLLQDAPKVLHPYNRASEALFSAIEYGWLPGDIFDDLPCKYLNGTIMCEVRDYRNFMQKPGNTICAGSKCPIVQNVQLHMSTENVIKDIPSISNYSWTYRDLLEVESRIVRALQPDLCLDPNPSLERLCKTPFSKKFNSRLCTRHKRVQNHVSSVKIMTDKIFNGQNIPTNGFLENSKSQASVDSTASSTIQHSESCDIRQEALAGANQPNPLLPTNCSISFPTTAGSTSNFVSGLEQKIASSYDEPRHPNAGLLGKRDQCEAQPTSRSTLKKPKQEQIDFVPQQFVGNQATLLARTDPQWKNNLLQKRLEAERIQSAKRNGQKHLQIGIRDGPQKNIEGIPKIDSRTQLYKQNPIPSPMQWNYSGQLVEKGGKREYASYKRKSSLSPRVSTGGVAHSPASSSKSGEISTYSVVAPHSTGPATIGIRLDVEKSILNTTENSGFNGSLLRENQLSLHSKRKSNSVPKTPSVTGVRSPARNTNAPLSVNSSSVGTPPVPIPVGSKGNPSALDRFLKIEMVANRHKLNVRSTNSDELVDRKPLQHSSHLVAFQLAEVEDTKDFKDPEKPMSKSLLGGTSNVCKTRFLSFVRSPHIYHGNGIPVLVREIQSKLVISEKANDRTVEGRVLYGDEEETDPFGLVRFSLPTLPNTHHADMFATQFTSLMLRDGYELTDDQIQGIPDRTLAPMGGQPTGSTSTFQSMGAAELPYGLPISVQSSCTSTSISKAIFKQMPSSNVLARGRMIQNTNLQSLPLSSGYLARSHQMDPTIHQSQRSFPLVANNSAGNTSLQICNQTVNSNPLAQFQLQNKGHGQQIQYQHLMHRKMMGGGMGPAVGVGNVGVSTPGLGNIVDMRCFGGSIPGPAGLTNISHANNLSQASFSNSNQQICLGGLFPSQAAALKMRLMQNRGRGMVSGGPIQSAIEAIGEMTATRSIPGRNLLSQPVMRGAPVQIQSAAAGMALMGPPKATAMSYIMNQQQLQQQTEQPQLLHQIGSPMQHPQGSGLADQVGSPSSHVSSQQMSQLGPMSPQQLSSGLGPQQTHSGNIGGGPGSPQLSSQTHGSIGSITNSPMDWQGMNHGDSDDNAGVNGE